ncbi:GNAT family N-acetyltransferase [Rhizomonospora bruguierae]|uniref:GNAT family N-acetyltransferase n=1 Tax=Rhizomonospora bruguierae TaxID=1581705 RepID=UPI001BCFE14D|nr:GNAT family N-acetyltransferase [Micromonospora sp. NBRC 107566]
MTPARIAPLDLSDRVTDAVAVMAAAFGLSTRDSRERGVIFDRHAQRPGLVAYGAFDTGDRLTGFCYGFPGQDGGWWANQIEPHLAAAGHADWLRDAFELTELHVHPDHQRRGLGRTLITTVCGEATEPRVLLSAKAGETPARHLYRTLGFVDLTGPFRFVGFDTPYRVMGASLPLPG